MKTSQILLALASTAAAIDVYLFPGDNCQGNSGVCRGLNPNTCCPGSVGNDLGSVGFYGIPTNWHLETRGHSGGQCNNVQERGYVSGVTWICLTRFSYSGAGYSFTGKKRGEGEFSQSAKMDSFLLEDGTEINIADLDESSIAELVCIV
jgi:hypothetical protein